MSAVRGGEYAPKRGKRPMSLEAVQEARRMMIDMTKFRHRGPGDTWTAARDRLAGDVGLSPANLERLWDKWKTMKDVSGGVLLALQRAYDAECLKHERAADHYRSLREGTSHGQATGKGPASAGLGMAAAAEIRPEQRSAL